MEKELLFKDAIKINGILFNKPYIMVKGGYSSKAFRHGRRRQDGNEF
jgi:hypothetical protein